MVVHSGSIWWKYYSGSSIVVITIKWLHLRCYVTAGMTASITHMLTHMSTHAHTHN